MRRTFCLIAVIALSACDTAPRQSAYFKVEPGANFSRYQLQCAVNAIEDQRRANSSIQHWERCSSATPRLTALQETLRGEWRSEQRAKWEARCAREIPSLQPVCNDKLQNALSDYPDHLKVPPVYPELRSRPLDVTEWMYKQAKNESNLQKAASSIVLDRVEADSKLNSALFSATTNSSYRPPKQSQEEKDNQDLQIGYCAKWIGRTAPNAVLITEEYLDQQLAKCVAN